MHVDKDNKIAMSLNAFKKRESKSRGPDFFLAAEFFRRTGRKVLLRAGNTAPGDGLGREGSVINSGSTTIPQIGPYRKCSHVQTSAHGHVFEMSRNLGISDIS